MIDNDGRPGHTHRLPRALLLTLIIICVGLLASIVLVSTLAYQAQHEAAMTNQRLDALEGFIADRGEVRDQQNESLGDRITAAVCDLLDRLPAGPVLDPVRATYGCGPGLPVESLSPEAQQQLQGYQSGTQQPAVKPLDPPVDRKAPRPDPLGTDAPATPTVVPPPVAPVQPAPVPGTPVTPPSAPTSAPTQPPLIDLGPITDPLCTGLGLCL